jgi:cold shock CspA family protein/ribosome-associated translation inhibitor RaiA
MQVPLQIVFEGLDSSEALESLIRSEAEKLERIFDRITAARVVVEAPHRKNQASKIYEVRIHLTLPGGRDVVVDRDPGRSHAHDEAAIAVRDAFKAAARQLQDKVKVLRGYVKAHETPPHGRVLRIDEDHGFIAAADGRELYFHRNAVLNDGFAKLEVGAEVRFDESIGVKGPQASTVRPVGKHHIVG